MNTDPGPQNMFSGLLKFFLSIYLRVNTIENTTLNRLRSYLVHKLVVDLTQNGKVFTQIEIC